MARGILRKLRAVSRVVQQDITRASAGGGLYARGLANEGYAGGYLDALRDVQAMLTHGYPSDTRGFWNRAQRMED